MVRIAFVGCGDIAHVHYRALKRIGLSVDAVCDLCEVRAREFATRYGIRNATHSIPELFDKCEPSVVHVLVPPQYHFNIAKRALRKNCHVFLEKPICETSKELAELKRLAKEKNLIISVDHTRVFNPLVSEAREWINNGEFGQIVEMRYEYDDPGVEKTGDPLIPLRYRKGTPAWFKSLKGGVVADLLPHPISVLLSFDSKLTIKSINGIARSRDIIEELSVRLQSEKTVANIFITLRVKPLRNRLSIFCEHGSIIIDLRNMYSVYLPDRALPNTISRAIDTLSLSIQTQSRFLKSVFRFLQGKIHPYSGLEIILDDFYRTVDKANVGSSSVYSMLNIEKTVELQERCLDHLLALPNVRKVDRLKKEIIERKKKQDANVLVTGGTGFIGSYLTNELLKENYTVRVLCRDETSAYLSPPRAGVAIGDIGDKRVLEDALKGIEVVYHCASAMSGDWAAFHSSTIHGTETILSLCKKMNIRTFVYLSSLSILNYNKLSNGDLVDENSPLETEPEKRGLYTKAKLQAEKIVMKFQEENPHIRVIIVRPGLVYGKESNNNLKNAGILLGKWLLVFGMGKRFLGLAYVENLARVLVGLIKCENRQYEKLLNIVDPEQPTVSEYISFHNKLTNNKIRAIYLPIWLWRGLFGIADVLFTLIRRQKSHYLYKFASNSKRLIFANRVIGEDKMLKDYISWKNALKKCLE